MTTASFTIQANDNSQIEFIKELLSRLKVKFEFNTIDKPYNPEFVAKIQESRAQITQGKFTEVKQKDIKSFIGSL